MIARTLCSLSLRGCFASGALGAAAALLLAAAPASAQFVAPIVVSEWIGGAEPWEVSASWTAGVPNAQVGGRISNGGFAFIIDPAEANTLEVGAQLSRVPTLTTGEIEAIAPLTVQRSLSIGRGSAGSNRTARYDGSVRITDADLTLVDPGTPPGFPFPLIPEVNVGRGDGTGTDNHTIADGELTVVNGSIELQGYLNIAQVSGTGDRSRKTATGAVSVTGGDVTAVGRVNVGVASGTGETIGVATGVLTIDDGSLVISPNTFFEGLGQSATPGLLSIGSASTISNATGDVSGTVEVRGGDVQAGTIVVGRAGRPVDRAEGSLTVTDGDVLAEQLFVGLSNQGGDSTGGFTLRRGTAQLDELTIAADGAATLLIDGPGAGDGYAQIDTATADLDGVIEARFAADYRPAPGLVFDLIVADLIEDDYELLVTREASVAPLAGDRGRAPSPIVPQFVVKRTDNLLRLTIVPEPTTAALLLTAGLTSAVRNRPRGGRRTRRG